MPSGLKFKVHEYKQRVSTVEKWRAALREVADIAGFDLKNEADGIETKTTKKRCNQNQLAAPEAKKQKQPIATTSSTKRNRYIVPIPLEKIAVHRDKTRKDAADALCISEKKLVSVLGTHGFTWTQFKYETKLKQKSGKAAHLALTRTPHGDDVSNTSEHLILKSSYQYIKKVTTPSLSPPKTNWEINQCSLSTNLHGPNSNPHELVDDLRDHHNLPMQIQPGNANHMSLTTIPHGGDISNTFGLPVLNSPNQYENSMTTVVHQAINWNTSASAHSLDDTTSLMQNGRTNCQFPFQPQSITSPPELNLGLSYPDSHRYSPPLDFEWVNNFLSEETNQYSLSANLHVEVMDDLSNHQNPQIPAGNVSQLDGADYVNDSMFSSQPHETAMPESHEPMLMSHQAAIQNQSSATPSSLCPDGTLTDSTHVYDGTNGQLGFQNQNYNQLLVTTPTPEAHSSLCSDVTLTDPTQVYDGTNGQLGFQNRNHNQLLLTTPTPEAPSSLCPDVTLLDPTQVYDGTNGQLGFQNRNHSQLLVTTPTPGTGTPEKMLTVTVLAKYRTKTLKFNLSFESTKDDLEKEVMKRVNLEVGSFYLDYKDESGRWISICCDEDLENCMAYVRSSDSTDVEMVVQLND